MKRKIMLLVCLTLIPLICLPVLAHAETMICTVPDGQYVNIRNRASRTASTLGKLRGGDSIEVEALDGGWLCFTLDEQDAYVRSEYFEALDGSTYTIEANGRVRHRAAPGGKVSGFYTVGTEVVVDAWAYDDAGEKWGRIGETYVSIDFLKAVKPANEQGV